MATELRGRDYEPQQVRVGGFPRGGNSHISYLESKPRRRRIDCSCSGSCSNSCSCFCSRTTFSVSAWMGIGFRTCIHSEQSRWYSCRYRLLLRQSSSSFATTASAVVRDSAARYVAAAERHLATSPVATRCGVCSGG